MENYNLLKTELDNILNSNEIKYNETHISAYELRNIINDELKSAYELYESEKVTIKRINKKTKSFINKFTKNSIYENLYFIGFHTDTYFDNLTPKHYQRLVFHFIKNEQKRKISICKEKDNYFFKKTCFENELTKKDLNFFKENLEYITNTLNTMIYYNEQYNIEFSSSGIYTNNLTQIFNYSIFNIKFNFQGIQNNEQIEIYPSNYELTKTFYNLWLTKECLDDYTKKNIDKLLKRIPIQIEKLNPLYKQIISLKLEKSKTLQLKK